MLTGPRTIITCDDERYPARLLDLPDPPDALHVAGDPAVLGRLSIAVVGTRRIGSYGLHAVDDLVDIIANCNLPVVTGGTVGVAAAATEAALRRHVLAVAVLGSGLDMPYPTQHDGLFQRIVDNGGAVVSEHEDGYPPRPAGFTRRNRIINGLVEAVLVIEAGAPSGTFSLCDSAQRLADYITNLRWEGAEYEGRDVRPGGVPGNLRRNRPVLRQRRRHMGRGRNRTAGLS